MRLRILGIITVTLFLFLFFTSFSQNNEKHGITITDGAGRTVIIPRKIESIISLSPGNTEILYALGAGDRVVGVTEFCNYPPEAQLKTKVGGFADVNIEKIAELNPDLIFAAHIHISQIIPSLENLGFSVVVINPSTVRDVFSSIEFVGSLCNKEYESGILTAELRSRYNEITTTISEQKPVSVYWELSEDLWTIGKGSFLDDLITEAGGMNVAHVINAPWLQLSSEYIINANPHIIFLAHHPVGARADTLKNRPGWNTMTAVKENRIIEVPLDINDTVSRPGPRVIKGLAYIAAQLFPE